MTEWYVIMIAVVAAVVFFAMRINTKGRTGEKKYKARLQGVPRPEGGQILVAAGLLMAWALIGWVIGHTGLYDYRFFGVNIDGLLCLLVLVGGVLLVLGRKRMPAYVAGCVLLGFVMAGQSNSLWILLAVLLLLLSAVGVPFNRVLNSGPQWLRLPLLNLISMGMAALHLASGLNFSYYDYDLHEKVTMPAGGIALKLLLLLLMTGGLIVWNLGVEGRLVQREKELRPKLRTYPKAAADRRFTIGAVLVLICGVWELLTQVQRGMDGSIIGLLWSVLMPAAGFMLFLREKRDKLYLPAILLLLLNQIYELRQLNLISEYLGMGGFRIWTVFSPLALVGMLIGAIGVSWNGSLRGKDGSRKTPVLNLVAVVLLALGMLSVRSSMEYLTYFGGYSLNVGTMSAIAMIVGLILVNLAVETREVPRKPRKRVDLLQRFYGDVGGNLQKLAKLCGVIWMILGVLCLISAALGLLMYLLIIIGLVDFYDSDALALILPGLMGALVSFLMILGTWPLYAFGQITADLRAIKEKKPTTVPERPAPAPEQTAAEPQQSMENPDELPEL